MNKSKKLLFGMACIFWLGAVSAQTTTKTPTGTAGKDATTKTPAGTTGKEDPAKTGGGAAGTATALSKEDVTKKAAEDFFNKGEQLRKYKDFKDALLEYDKAMTMWPQEHKYSYSKALCHFSMNDTASTIAMLEKTVALKDDFVNAHVLLAKAYGMKKDNAKAAKSFAKAAQYEETKEKQIAYLSNAAQIQVKEKDYKGSIETSKKILEKDASNVMALYFSAQAYNSMGEYQKAVASMASATGVLESSTPQNSAKLYYELGYAYHQLGDFNKSQEAFKNASFGHYKALIAKLTPDFYYNVAYAYLKVMDYDAAIENLKTSLKMKQDFSKSHIMQGEIALKKLPNNEAVQHYMNALKDADKTKKETVYTALIELMFNAKQYDKALMMAEEGIAEFVTNREIKFYKALCLYRLKKLPDAALELENLVLGSSNPTEQVTYCFALGLVYAEKKDLEKARKYFKEAAKGPFMYAAQQEYEKIKPETPVGTDDSNN